MRSEGENTNNRVGEKSPREIIEPWKRVSEIRVMIEE